MELSVELFDTLAGFPLFLFDRNVECAYLPIPLLNPLFYVPLPLAHLRGKLCSLICESFLSIRANIA